MKSASPARLSGLFLSRTAFTPFVRSLLTLWHNNCSRLQALESNHPFSFLERSITMLGWAIGFLLVALLAAVFGFGGIASASAGIAKILFFVFLVLFLVSIVLNLTRGKA
jgi:uncharacterized membrane protein YtjA (UPF0391 family)